MDSHNLPGNKWREKIKYSPPCWPRSPPWRTSGRRTRPSRGRGWRQRRRSRGSGGTCWSACCCASGPSGWPGRTGPARCPHIWKYLHEREREYIWSDGQLWITVIHLVFCSNTFPAFLSEDKKVPTVLLSTTPPLTSGPWESSPLSGWGRRCGRWPRGRRREWGSRRGPCSRAWHTRGRRREAGTSAGSSLSQTRTGHQGWADHS